MSVLKDSLLALSKNLNRHVFKMPDVGTVTLCELTARERIEYESFVCSTMDKYGRIKSSTRLAAKLVQLGVENEDQQKVFGANDFEEITKMPASVVNELAGVVALLSGIVSAEPRATSDDDDDTDAELEEAEPQDPNDEGEL